jgi:outer membrane protein OmpA-like peptidoglycan-associated protein
MPRLADQSFVGRAAFINRNKVFTNKMSMTKMAFYIVALVAIFSSAGCNTQPVKLVATERNEASDLETTIKALGHDLALQMSNVAKANGKSDRKRIVLIDRFVDSQSGQVTAAFRRISNQLPDVMSPQLDGFDIRSMQLADVTTADYVLSGSIALESHIDQQKNYRIFASVTDIKSGMVVANARVWLRATRELDTTPEAAYGDSPVYLSDQATAALITTTKTLPGARADDAYIASLNTNALLNEAEDSYNRGDLQAALQMYAEAAKRVDGQVMRTYSGLYLLHNKAGNREGTERAFSELIGLGLGMQQISVKFLFKVASTAFMEDPKQSSQYGMWIRQISKQVAARNVCLEVLGHTSRTGSDSFNERLSLQRAEVISRTLIQHEASLQKKIRPIGLGSSKNIISSGTNDTRDAIDRRVEFKVVACG